MASLTNDLRMLGMSRMDKRQALENVKCFLLDMDGTFYLGNHLLEGSLDFLDALERTGRRAVFLTNNSSKSGQHYIDKLKRMGVKSPFLRVITSGHAAAHYVINRFSGGKGYLLGNQLLQDELIQMGLVFDHQQPDYVLIAYDTTLDYQKMTEVCNWVRKGLPYIATHPDLNCPLEAGYAPDIGAIIAFVEASTGRKPDVILGKPYRGIVDEALQVTGETFETLAMVGDRMYTDIMTGVRFGMTSILVLTGEATLADMESSEVTPHLVFNRLSDMIPYL